MTAPSLATAERFRSLAPSATVEMSERVRAARAAGLEIISLASGDPNLPTDPRIIDAADRALRDGLTHYSASMGEPMLRAAIVRREAERSGATYDPADVIVTPGGKFAVLTALMGVIEPGDEVLIPAPGWVSYGPCARLAGGVPVAIPMLDVLDREAVERAVTPRTRAVIANSPANPTGRVMDSLEMEALVEVASRHNLWIIFDQVYADLVYEGTATFPQSLKEGFERTLVVDSLSKSFSMTGWRLGYLATPGGVARNFVKFLQHSVYCVPAFIQAAGVRALELTEDLVPGYRHLFQARMKRATERLQQTPGIKVSMPPASMHLFPNVGGDEVAIARRWLDELHVAVLPGTAFGAAGAGFVRISLTCPDDQIDLALDRIQQAGV
jgi:aspartate/methionine/tyrosine aminotransferase